MEKAMAPQDQQHIHNPPTRNETRTGIEVYFNPDEVDPKHRGNDYPPQKIRDQITAYISTAGGNVFLDGRDEVYSKQQPGCFRPLTVLFIPLHGGRLDEDSLEEHAKQLCVWLKGQQFPNVLAVNPVMDGVNILNHQLIVQRLSA